MKRFNTKDGQLEIVSYICSTEVVVRFVNTGYITTTTSRNIDCGSVKDRLRPVIDGVGYLGDGPYSTTEHVSVYGIWRKVLKNCCSQWCNFQIFCEWYVEYKNVDSSLKRKCSTLPYSPDNCYFEPYTNTIVYDSHGNPHHVTNKAMFCRKHGLNYSCFLGLFSGNTKQHRGWRLDPRHETPVYILYDSTGKSHMFSNISAFSAAHGLNKSYVGQVLKGKMKQHKGWTTTGDVKPVQMVIVKDPQGVPHFVTNKSAFCRQHGLNYQAFLNLLADRVKQHKGWRK